MVHHQGRTVGVLGNAACEPPLKSLAVELAVFCSNGRAPMSYHAVEFFWLYREMMLSKDLDRCRFGLELLLKCQT
ncbi:hypothetical protein D3C77_334640 [compost metagenome]